MSNEKQFLTIKLDASELTPAQVRLLKYLNSMLLNTITTGDEADYFDCANEAMRMFATLLRGASFTQIEQIKDSDIPYERQVIEYCLETIYEDMARGKIATFDN